ncbi:TPA: hypothetical protein ACH3X1_013836 [Trebouxia sp. C0004]
MHAPDLVSESLVNESLVNESLVNDSLLYPFRLAYQTHTPLKRFKSLSRPLKHSSTEQEAYTKAKSSRSEEATQMVFRADEDIPYEVMVNPTGCVEAGAHAYLAKQEKLAHDQLDPRVKGLAVGAGSQLISPAIRQQMPSCAHKALLCDSHIALLKAEGRMVMKQLQQRAALADLLTAAGSGDATAKSRLK